jgi:hypothetical protein
MNRWLSIITAGAGAPVGREQELADGQNFFS